MDFFSTVKPPLFELKNIEEHLHAAEVSSVADLFDAFSLRPPNKRGIFHRILYEDETHVYWGRPFFKYYLFVIEKNVVERLYKTAKADLEKELPSYKDIWAHTIRNAVVSALSSHADSAQNTSELTIATCQASLQVLEDGKAQILVQVTTQLSQATEQEKTPVQADYMAYAVILDVENISLVSIEAK